MATIFWVEDQSHWIDEFKPVLESTAFDDVPTQVQVFKFAEAACQHICTLRLSFDQAMGGAGDFVTLCKQGQGIAAFGDEGAYCWKPIER